MRIMTICGTRPEIIRLSRILPKLDKVCEHILVHTDQNYDKMLSDIFFTELKLRRPDYFLGNKSSNFGEQIGLMFQKLEEILIKVHPDKVLILGDTNSGLCSIVCERLGIPIFHMEAGNRCFDKRVPEEINRKIIDGISTFNLPYTQLSKENLIHDGVPKNKIFVTGNPIYEVLEHYSKAIERSNVLSRFGLKKGKYFLSTFHRAENVNDPVILRQIIAGLSLVANCYERPIICSIHPRTRDRINKLSEIVDNPFIMFCEPLGFFDFVKLESNAKCIISDSGTVSEEACILGVPNVIIRNSTERPELIECGSSILAGVDIVNIKKSVELMANMDSNWTIPEGYNNNNVSDVIIKILLGENK